MCTVDIIWSTGVREKRDFPTFDDAWDWVHKVSNYSQQYGCLIKTIDYIEKED